MLGSDRRQTTATTMSPPRPPGPNATPQQDVAATIERGAPLEPGQQLRVLATLTAQLELQALVAAIPDALRDIAKVDGVRYRSPSGDDTKAGRRARHSIEYRLLPAPDEPLGLLTFYRGTPFRELELARLEAALPLFMHSLRNALAYRDAVTSASLDPLTGVGNRAAMDSHGNRQVDLAHRHSMPLSLLMIDIDYFKRINDSYGHAKGDAVLQLLGKVLARAIRRSDEVFRYGGEEFVVVLGHTDAAGAQAIAERVRILVAANRDLAREVPQGVTVSIGVSTLGACETFEMLCERADNALYDAKRNGRNRVVSSRAVENDSTATAPTAPTS